MDLANIELEIAGRACELAHMKEVRAQLTRCIRQRERESAILCGLWADGGGGSRTRKRPRAGGDRGNVEGMESSSRTLRGTVAGGKSDLSAEVERMAHKLAQGMRPDYLKGADEE